MKKYKNINKKDKDFLILVQTVDKRNLFIVFTFLL